MRASDIATLPIAAGAALRHRRFFHPTGVLASGSIERLAPPREGLPIESGAITGRVSKALGAPGGLPDAAGLAWRMPPAAFAATPWDVLLVTAGLGFGSAVTNRMLLRPVSSWAGAAYSSLMPLRYHDGDQDQLWWLRARLLTPLGGLWLKSIAEEISAQAVEFEVEQAHGTADFAPLARLRFTEVLAADESHDVAFDPVRHTAPGVEVWPQWLRDVRQAAYQSSREGRDAG